MLKEIKKTDLSNWSYGDVCIKTYSYGDLLTIKDMGDVKENPETTKLEIKANPGFTGIDIGLRMLSSGIHYIRNVDGTDFILKPNSSIEEKNKFCFNLDSESSFYLLNEINKINSSLSDQEKK